MANRPTEWSTLFVLDASSTVYELASSCGCQHIPPQLNGSPPTWQGHSHSLSASGRGALREVAPPMLLKEFGFDDIDFSPSCGGA
jgi:hypothetical protein